MWALVFLSIETLFLCNLSVAQGTVVLILLYLSFISKHILDKKWVKYKKEKNKQSNRKK